MTKREAFLELASLFEQVLEDNQISTSEIHQIQDWIDENAFLFVGNEYEQIIIPLQKFIEDGIYTDSEIQCTFNILRKFM